MKKLAWVSASAVLLAGCQGGGDPTTASVAPGTSQAPHVKQATVAAPSSEGATEVALMVKPDRPIKVGASVEEVTSTLKDTKLFAFGSDALPAKFDYPYRVQTWESSRYGFGTISYDGAHVVGVMYEQDKFTQDRVDDVVKAHNDQMSDIKPIWIQGKHVNYWFWEGAKQRTMVCAFDSGRNGIQLTVAMGDDVVMDALGISPQLAEKDSIVVDTMITHAQSAPRPAKS